MTFTLRTTDEFNLKTTGYEDSAIAITARVWVKNKDYWSVYGYLLHGGKAEFDKNGIEIPFNQLEVHIKNS